MEDAFPFQLSFRARFAARPSRAVNRCQLTTGANIRATLLARKTKRPLLRESFVTTVGNITKAPHYWPSISIIFSEKNVLPALTVITAPSTRLTCRDTCRYILPNTTNCTAISVELNSRLVVKRSAMAQNFSAKWEIFGEEIAFFEGEVVQSPERYSHGFASFPVPSICFVCFRL